MRRQLAAVLLAYATRRMLWWWGLVYFLITACGLWDTSPPSDEMISAAPISSPAYRATSSREALDRLVEKERAEQVTDIDCHAQWGDPDLMHGRKSKSLKLHRALNQLSLEDRARRNPLPQFDRFPALRSLNLNFCVITAEDSARIAKLPNLRWLSLEGAVIVDGDLRFLSELHNLETLTLGTTAPATAQPTKLPEVKRASLRTLVVDCALPEATQALQTVGREAEIRDLVLKNATAAADRIAAIAAMPDLRRLYVGGVRPDSAGIKSWENLFPDVTVWRAELARRRVHAVIYLVGAVLCIGSAMTLQTSNLLGVPAARLFPRFATPHLLLHGILLVGALLLQSWMAGRNGVDFYSAVGVQAFLFGWVVIPRTAGQTLESPTRRLGGTVEAPAPNIGRRRWPVPTAALANVLATILLVGTIWLPWKFPYLLESLLLGELPLWTGFLTAFGVVRVGYALSRLPHLSVMLNEAGLAPALSWEEMQQPGPESGYGRYGSPADVFRLASRPSPAGWWWRMQAARIGNTLSLRSILRHSSGMVVLVVVMHMFLKYLSAGDDSSAPLNCWFIFLPIAQIIASWSQRRSTLSSDLLLPWTKQEMTQGVFLGMAADFAAMLVIPLGLLPLANYWLTWNYSAMGLLVIAATIVAGTACVWGLSLMLLTIRDSRLEIFFFCLGIGAIFFVGFIGAVYSSDASPRESGLLRFLVWSTIVNSLIATLLGIGAYKRWMRMEWGLFAPSE